MKKGLSVLVFSLGISFVNAQTIKEAEVPSVVKTAFAKMYPGIKNEKWGKEGNHYEASFTSDTYGGSVLFDVSGKWKERETSIPITALPLKARTYMQTHFKNEKLQGAAKITMTTGELHYKAEIKDRGVFFTKDGKFIKQG